MKPSVFRTHKFIPFQLGDPAGVLFFAHHFTLAHEALEQFIVQSLELNWNDWFHHSDWIIPIKESKAHYQQPLYAGKSCDILVTIEDFSTSSVTFHYDFLQDGLSSCNVATIHVFCDRATRKKIEIPTLIKQKLIQTKNMSAKYDQNVFQTHSK